MKDRWGQLMNDARQGGAVGSARGLGVLGVVCCVLSFIAITANAQVDEAGLAASMATHERVVKPFLAQHCMTCHGADDPQGDITLDALEPDMKASTSGARWAVVLDKLAKDAMPPKKVKARPDAAAVAAVTDWIKAEMKRAGRHVAHRETFHNGNLVPHELLFDPKQSAPLEVAGRLRRLSPEIYAGFLGEVVKRDTNIASNPFSPEGGYIFKDMGDPKIDEPVAAMLIRNALAIVERQTAYKVENGVLKSVGFSPKEYLVLFDEKNQPTDVQIEAAIKIQFDRVLKRQPSQDELTRFTALLKKNISQVGRDTGVRYALAAVFLLPEAVYRMEIGTGAADEKGRVRLSPREIAFALSFALTDRRPENWLLDDAAKGKLDTAEGVAAATRKMLDDPKLDKVRIPRFFREYFGYDHATEVFKNDKENSEHEARALVEDTDRLVQFILDEDRQVLRELLTTNKSFVAYKTAADTKKKRAEAMAKFEDEKAKNPEKFKDKKPPKVGRSVFEAYNLTDFPDQQPVELPRDQRAGILTQPAWLVAWSQNENNHAILRGKWVRERLLGGVVPELPITVDAQLPVAPEQTLRQRMAITQQDYCWKCHQLMNNLGYPFELYDHFGRHRQEEVVLDLEATAKNVDKKNKPLGPVHRNVPLNTKGGFEFVHGASLSGEVNGAVEFMHKMAASEYVEQVFVRHAFRYWMGRNENLGDAAALQAAHKAYRQSDGSMKALITALLTSDSFLYRVASETKSSAQSAR